jgi:hypothetical protein
VSWGRERQKLEAKRDDRGRVAGKRKLDGGEEAGRGGRKKYCISISERGLLSLSPCCAHFKRDNFELRD